VADFIDKDLTSSRFERVYLTGARFHLVDLTGVTISGSALVDVDISGRIRNLRVNGVDVAPLVEAELNRRYPDRAKMRPADADGFRDAWDILERLWAQTVTRARGMDPELLHERVDGEWSFIQTLRHLVFATDAWVNRAILGQPSPWHPLDLPADEIPDEPSVPRDPDARPPLEEVLALRGPDGHRPPGAGRPDRREAGGRHGRGHGAGFSRAGELRRAPVPAGHPQRGVGAPAVRRTGPRRAGPALFTGACLMPYRGSIRRQA